MLALTDSQLAHLAIAATARAGRRLAMLAAAPCVKLERAIARGQEHAPAKRL
jgi:hypothetical protein